MSSVLSRDDATRDGPTTCIFTSLFSINKIIDPRECSRQCILSDINSLLRIVIVFVVIAKMFKYNNLIICFM